MDTVAIKARVDALRVRHATRDRRWAEIQAVRRGDVEKIAPDFFNEEWQRPIVANLVETAAQDVAAVLAPLPSFNCSASSGVSETAKAFADKRTKIARNYITASELELQMNQWGADRYNTYGLMVLEVIPDFAVRCPRILIRDSVGSYPVWNSWGETVEYAQVTLRDRVSLEADYPQVAYATSLRPQGVWNGMIEVIEYVSKTGRVTCFCPSLDVVLEDFDNGIGRCHIVCVQRPSLDDTIRGAYDDAIWIQLARHRLQMLVMEGVDKAVRAPLVMPTDAVEVPLGPDAVIQTREGVGSVGRARLDMPAQAFGAVEQLKGEQQTAAMSPEVRSGNLDASVITGRGVQQLLVGFSAQVAKAQTQFKWGFKRAIRIAFEMDEKVFGGIRKELRGNDAGVPYATTYIPLKDIDGDYSIDVTYGFAAGLDPNRALVFLLQADGAGLVSKDTVRRSLPVDLNAVEEERKITIEQSRLAIVAAMSALSQSIPQIVAQGGDPTQILNQQARFIELVRKGKDIETAVSEALTPPPPPQSEPITPEGETGGGSGVEGFTGEGLPAGLQPGAVLEGPGGRPDLQQFFAGLTSSGQPNLGTVVSRMKPVGV